jgi:hypothetical protein
MLRANGHPRGPTTALRLKPLELGYYGTRELLWPMTTATNTGSRLICLDVGTADMLT